MMMMMMMYDIIYDGDNYESNDEGDHDDDNDIL